MKKDLYIDLECSFSTDGLIVLSPDLVKDLGVHPTKAVGMLPRLEDSKPTFAHIFWDSANNTFAFTKVAAKDFEAYPCVVAHYLREREQVAFISYSPNVAQICYRLGLPLDEDKPIRIPIRKDKLTINGNSVTAYIFA